MAIEARLTGIADQLDHEEVDLEEPISDAGHTVGQGLAATMREGAAEIARLRARVEELEAVGGPVSQMTLDEWVRQMTLDEWVNILPAPHRAVVELAALRWKVEGLERVVKFAISQGAHSHLCAARSSGPCDCWKRTVSDDLAAIDAAREGE